MQNTPNELLYEASYPEGSIGKVIKLYVSILQKRTGLKIFKPRFAFISELTKGLQGQRFFVEGKKAFRFNWRSNSIQSISVWTKPGPTSKPNYTIDVSDLNSNQIISLLASVLTKQKIETQEYALAEEKNFSSILSGIFEAKIDQNELFAKFMSSETDAISKVKNKSELADLWVAWAQRKGIENPKKTIVHNPDVKLGNRIKPGSGGIKVELPPNEAQIKFLASIGLKPGEKLSASSLFKKVETYTDKIINSGSGGTNAKGEEIKTPTSLIVAGDPGIGKTTYAEKRLRALGSEAEIDEKTGKADSGKWKKFSSKMSASELYKNLFAYNGKILLLDDIKGPLDDSVAIDLLKNALDDKPQRRIDLNVDSADLRDPKKIARLEKEIRQIERRVDTAEGAEKPNETLIQKLNDKIESLKDDIREENNKPPKQFIYTGKIIFITNRDLNDIDPAIAQGRSLTVNIVLSGEQSVQLVKDKLEGLAPGVPMKDKQELLEFLTEMVQSGSYKGKLNLRVFNNAMETWVTKGIPLQEKKQWIFFDLKDAGDK